MTQHLTETELLGYIEGQLDAESAARVRAVLAEQPVLVASLDRMRRDRDVLMSMEDPHVDVDLLSRVESALARPMLIDSKPGEFRRSRRRSGLRWGRYSAAAGVVLALSLGAWLMNSGGNGPPAPSDSNDVALIMPGELRYEASDDGVFDVSQPSPIVADADDMTSSSAAIAHVDASDIPDVLTATFALVMMAPDEDFATNLLASAVDELGTAGAVVRNVSEHDLRQFIAYEQTRVAAERQREHRSPVMADESGRVVASRTINVPQNRIDLPRRPVPKQLELEPLHLAGSEELAAPMPCQIDFSNMGAQYTVAIRASELERLTSKLQLHNQCPSTALCPLSSDVLDSYRSCTPPINLDHLRSVREAGQELDELRMRGRDAIVQLPVMYVQCDDCGLGRANW